MYDTILGFGYKKYGFRICLSIEYYLHMIRSAL
nr:MAG TPA: hypothetical protein [Caudoviricetes sp.]